MTVALISAGAALLASLITALATMGVIGYQERRRAAAAEEDALTAAAQVVLNKGLTMIDRSRLWSGLLQGHSRPDGQIAVLLRLRAPIDPARIIEPLIGDQEALHFAGAHIALHADQRTVELCNRVLQAANIVAVALLPRARQGRLHTVAQGFVGLARPDGGAIRSATNELTQARAAFANHLRATHKRQAIDVYAMPSD